MPIGKNRLAEIGNGSKLAINLQDIFRLDEFHRKGMVVDKCELKLVECGRSKEDAALIFSCPLLEAAMICDIIRSDNRKDGDYPTRVYLLLPSSERWLKLEDNTILCDTSSGKCLLNKEVFFKAPIVRSVPKVVE